MYIHGVVVEGSSVLVVSHGSSVTVVWGSVVVVSGRVVSAGVVGTTDVERLAVRMTGLGVVFVGDELSCLVKVLSVGGNAVVVVDGSCGGRVLVDSCT